MGGRKQAFRQRIQQMDDLITPEFRKKYSSFTEREAGVRSRFAESLFKSIQEQTGFNETQIKDFILNKTQQGKVLRQELDLFRQGGGMLAAPTNVFLPERSKLREGRGGRFFINEDAMATPMSVGNNYVQPVFNKKDKFYAAKDGGAIANALDEVLSAVDKLIEEKQDVNLDINERKLAQAVNNAYSAIQRRNV